MLICECVRDILTDKDNKSHSPRLVISNSELTDHKTIANAFNSHFVEIAPKYRSAICPTYPTLVVSHSGFRIVSLIVNTFHQSRFYQSNCLPWLSNNHLAVMIYHLRICSIPQLKVAFISVVLKLHVFIHYIREELKLT